MARTPRDAALLDGPLKPTSVSLDPSALELIELIGDGDKSLGARECIRLALLELERQHRAPAAAMARLSKRAPERVARYYADHPEQVAEYSATPVPPTLPRSQGSARRPTTRNPILPPQPAAPGPTVYPLEIQRARDEAYRARLAAEQAQEPTVVPGFEGWDD